MVLARIVTDGTRSRLSDQRIAVAVGGGIDPSWRNDAREILYLAPDRTIRAVGVTIAGDAVSIGKPVPLFRIPADAGGWGANWTANSDHTKFVAVDSPHGSRQTFRVLTNWRQ